MDDWFEFNAAIEPLIWGRTTYTILRLPADVGEALVTLGATRVEGDIEGVPVNLALITAAVVDGPFLWAGKSLLAKLKIEAGQPLQVRLRIADPDEVVVPEDIHKALVRAGLLAAWEQLTPGKRRSLLYPVESARTEPTRGKRIDVLLAAVLMPW